MNKKNLYVLIMLSLLITLGACGNKEDEMTIEDIAVEYSKEDQEKLDEAESFLKEGKLKDVDMKSYSDYMISVFNQLSDKHIVYTGIGNQLTNLSIEALSKDLREETKDYKYIARKEIQLLDRLKAGRQNKHGERNVVESIFNDENQSEFVTKIAKLDEKYEEYRKAKGIEE